MAGSTTTLAGWVFAFAAAAANASGSAVDAAAPIVNPAIDAAGFLRVAGDALVATGPGER